MAVLHSWLSVDGLHPSFVYVAPLGLVLHDIRLSVIGHAISLVSVDGLHPSLVYAAPLGLNDKTKRISPERDSYANIGLRPIKWQRHKTQP